MQFSQQTSSFCPQGVRVTITQTLAHTTQLVALAFATHVETTHKETCVINVFMEPSAHRMYLWTRQTPVAVSVQVSADLYTIYIAGLHLLCTLSLTHTLYKV